MKRIVVQKDSYYDSVFLMSINQDVKSVAGISEAVVAMGTEMNRDLLKDMGLTNDEVAEATANDLIIALEGEGEEALSEAEAAARKLLSKKSGAGDTEQYRPTSLEAAKSLVPEANLTIISLPGEYAARDVRRALREGMHVMLFSDNVPLEQEIELKNLAKEKGLLMMGPDCGTAIINGKPLCFANVVRQGSIGIVAASGTGLQEVSCSIHNRGSGVSQAIGTGGRDLKNEKVGGTMMLMGIEALAQDPATSVITVVSKPPAEAVAEKVIRALKESGKASVVHFIGLEKRAADGKVHFAANLEEAAGMAVALSRGEAYQSEAFTISDSQVDALVERESAGMAAQQQYLRGLYTGGTLADEALILLHGRIGNVYSNNQGDDSFQLSDPHNSQGHTIVDLGEDQFTVGRPHPMIDPSTRTDRMEREMEDPEMAVLLLDVVIGYGSHGDPAGAMADHIRRAKEKAVERGGYLSVVTSITGTDGDPQSIEAQRRTLESLGCVVMPSNYQASMLALRILEKAGAK